MSKFVAHIIERYIGDFIELDKENFNVSLFTETRIQNVAVKPDLLSQFVDSPVYGHVENITVSPNLGNTKPIEVSIDGVYVALLLTNADLSKSIDPAEAKRRRLAANDIQMKRKHGCFDKQFREQQQQQIKQQQNLQQQNSQQQNGGNEFTKSEIFSRMLLKRLSVKISNVHIRIETDGACFGITLKSLFLGTNKKISEYDCLTPRNTFHLTELALYIDPPNEPGVTCPSKQDDFVRYLAETESMHEYILSPYSTSAGLYWPLSFDRENPPQARYVLSGDLDRIVLRISKEQYSRIFVSLDSLKRQICLPQAIREKRPSETVKEKPLKWFMYAADAAFYQVRDRRRRLSPKFFEERFKNKKEYCKLYKLRLLGKLTGNTTRDLEAMEETLDMNDIIFFRSFAVAELSKSFQEKMKLDMPKLTIPVSKPCINESEVIKTQNVITTTNNNNNSTDNIDNTTNSTNNLNTMATNTSSSSNTKFGKFFSRMRTGLKASKKELDEKVEKEIIENKKGNKNEREADKEDLILDSGLVGNIPVFKMDLNVPNFEIVLGNKVSGKLTSVLTLKSSLGVSLTMPTQTATMTTISIDNLYGLGDGNQAFISYNSSRKQHEDYTPLISLGITADKGKTTLKANMQPIDIFLGSSAVSRIVEFGMPPPQVNVKELGTQVWNYIYTYVLLAQDIEDSDDGNNRVKAGPGKSLENLTLDLAVESPCIKILSESAATTVVNFQSIKLNSSNESTESSKILDFSVNGVSLETPGDENEPRMEIISPFNIDLTLGLPVLDSKKECDSINILGRIGSIQVRGNEQMARHIINASKPFCSLLAPLVVNYVNAVSQNLDEKFGIDTSGISSGAKEEMSPVKLDMCMERLSVIWYNGKSEKPSAMIDTEKGATFNGKVAHYCFDGKVLLPLLTITEGDEKDKTAPILLISNGEINIEEAACTSCTIGLDSIDVNFDVNPAVGTISDIISTVQNMIPIIDENFVKVAQENPVNPPLGSDASKMFSIGLNINQIKAKAWDETEEVFLDIVVFNANISHKKRDLITADTNFGSIKARARSSGTEQFVFFELGNDTKEGEKQLFEMTYLLGDHQKCDMKVAMNNIYMNTAGINITTNLVTRISDKITKSLPPQQAKNEDNELEKFLFEGDFPFFLIDFDLHDISVEFVPNFVRNMELEINVARVSYKNTETCPYGKALICGVDLAALGIPLSLKPLDVEVTPSLKISRAPQNRLCVEVNIGVSDVVLSMIPMQIPRLTFLTVGTVAQLFSTTMETNPFPKFLTINIPKISVPHVEVHIKPNENEDNIDNNVMKIFIKNISVSGEMVYNRQTIEISGDTLCVIPNSDNNKDIQNLDQDTEKCAVFTIERRIDDDAFRYNIFGDINRLTITEFEDNFLFQRMVPFAGQMNIDFNDLMLPASYEKDIVPTFVSLIINLNSDISLDYVDRAKLCIRGPLSVAFDLKFHGAVLGYGLRVDSKNEIFASDYKVNKILSVVGLKFELGFNHETLSASTPGIQLSISQINLVFWPGILSGIIIPVMKCASELPSLLPPDNGELALKQKQLVVPGFMDNWTVGFAIKKIDVDVRRLANSKDCNITFSIPGIKVEALLEQGKLVSPTLLRSAKLSLSRVCTVCDQFTLSFMDDTTINACIKDDVLAISTTPIVINIQRSNLAVFYAIFHTLPQVIVLMPKLNSNNSHKTEVSNISDRQETLGNPPFGISIFVPNVSLKWVNCFACKAEDVIAQCKGGDWIVDVKRLTASDENINKMADLPLLSLSENEEKPSVKISIKKSKENDLLIMAIDVGFIDMFFTPEIISTVVSDIIWMKNYNDYNYDDAETITGESVMNEEEPAIDSIASTKVRSRIELRFNIERISVCIYEDHTTKYCLGRLQVSLDHFLLGLANTSSGIDLELFSVAVKNMNLEVGFSCYIINKLKEIYRKDDLTKVAAVTCNKIDVNLTDGVASSFYIEADPLSVNVNAELLIPFIQNHVKRIKVSFASVSTGSKVDKRHFDEKHQNWSIPAQEMDIQKQIFEARYSSMKTERNKNKSTSKIIKVADNIKRFFEKNIVVKKINLCGLIVDFYAQTTKSRVNLALFGVKCSLNGAQLRTLQFCLNASASNEEISSPLIIPWEVNFLVLDSGHPSIQFTSDKFELSLDSHSLKYLCDVLDCFQVDDTDFDSEGPTNENEYIKNQQYFTTNEINSTRSVRIDNLCKCMKATIVLSLSPAAETIYQFDVEHWGVGICKEDTVGRGLEIAVPIQETDTNNIAYLIVSRPSGFDNCLRVKSPLVFHNKIGRNVDVCFKPNFSEPKVFSVVSNKSTVYGPPQFSSWSDHFFVGVLYGIDIGTYSLEKFQPFYWGKNNTRRVFEQLCIERPDSTPNQKKWLYISILSFTNTKGVPLANGTASDDTTTSVVKPLECVFLPTLYIENALPTKLMVNIFDTISGEFSKITIDGARTIGIIEVKRREHMHLSITFTTAIITGNTPAANIELNLQYPPISGSTSEQVQYTRTEIPVKVNFPENPKYDGILFACLTKDETFGLWKLRIYAKYLLINTTGIPLVSSIGSSIPIQNSRVMTSLVKFDKERGLILKERDGGMMVCLSSDFENYPFVMTLPQSKCSLGVKIVSSGNAYAGLHKIYIEHLYLIHNNTGESLILRQPQSEMKERQAERILPNKIISPVRYSITTRDHIISVALDGYTESIPFSIKDFIESTDEFIRLHSATDRNSFKILRVEIKKVESTTHIIFHKDDGNAPYILQNFSDIEIEFYQEGWKKYSQTVQPGKQAHFAWDSLIVEEKYLRIKGVLNEKIDICSDRSEGLFTLNNYQQGLKGTRSIKWTACVENGATVVRFFTKPRLSDLISQSSVSESTPEPIGSTIVSFAISVPQIIIKL